MTRAIVLFAAAAVLAIPASAAAGIFGTDPINISARPSGGQANGSSGGPAISGDNRKTRYAAFYSDASNLVGGDSNGKRDIFLWARPRGRKGLTLPRGAGTVKRVSVSNGGGQANGDSFSPSLDGSITKVAHCVAFQSVASNLAPGDKDKTADIFVRDIKARKTFLVSRAITGAASDPSIDGACRNVAFVASNKILVAPIRGGKAHVFGAGRNPDFSLDGSALTWERGSSVILRRNGRTSVVGAGDNPTVTDAERPAGKKVPQWGVSYDKSGNVLLRVLRPTGGPKKTINISRGFGGTNVNGGITAYGTVRGIVTFTHTDGDRTDAYYFNEHSGNSDDTAHSASNNGEPGIIEQVTSARANFIAFSSAFNGSLARGFSCRRGCDPASVFSETQNVYFKMLVDGEAL